MRRWAPRPHAPPRRHPWRKVGWAQARGLGWGVLRGDGLPGGVGCAAVSVAGARVGAVVAVNALGSVRDPESGRWVAGEPWPGGGVSADLRGQTTLMAVVTDAPVSKDGCTVVAKMAAAGLARTVFPAFTPFDGDIVFVASTNHTAPTVGAPELLAIGDAAARSVATAILRAVANPGA